ncbi:hypothetical protein SETIT_1G254400v2 [Setaria italica]|uniref:Uncharacterized protein n=1 Tax=Setaria italica TaxID=4555 RepID=A0A368PPJ0_SETIT|nr:hypothetical protein SETIT_1G254400v2 [Setaria italica]
MSFRASLDGERPASIPVLHYNSFLLLLPWMLWKHRNDLVFQRCAQRFWSACRDEARLWRERFRIEDRAITDSWCTLF